MPTRDTTCARARGADVAPQRAQKTGNMGNNYIENRACFRFLHAGALRVTSVFRRLPFQIWASCQCGQVVHNECEILESVTTQRVKSWTIQDSTRWLRRNQETISWPPLSEFSVFNFNDYHFLLVWKELTIDEFGICLYTVGESQKPSFDVGSFFCVCFSFNYFIASHIIRTVVHLYISISRLTETMRNSTALAMWRGGPIRPIFSEFIRGEMWRWFYNLDKLRTDIFCFGLCILLKCKCWDKICTLLCKVRSYISIVGHLYISISTPLREAQKSTRLNRARGQFFVMAHSAISLQVHFELSGEVLWVKTNVVVYHPTCTFGSAREHQH